MSIVVIYLTFFMGNEVIGKSDDNIDNMMKVLNSYDITYLSTTMAVFNDVLCDSGHST